MNFVDVGACCAPTDAVTKLLSLGKDIAAGIYFAAKWDALNEQEQADTSLIQLKMANGPESSGRRTQFLSRMVPLADVITANLTPDSWTVKVKTSSTVARGTYTLTITAAGGGVTRSVQVTLKIT